GRGIKRMIAACTGQAVELKRIPFDLVSRTVRANDAQRNALEKVHSAANDAAETLLAACPKDIPAELGQRLDQLGRALDIIRHHRSFACGTELNDASVAGALND